jgi:prepilin-type N-terminal cleavage/methylation domain-containing protein
LRGSRTPNPASRALARPGGFTLVELMLVMALLVIVVGVAFPSLQNFFRGRTLGSEARRFHSHTRYGQSRAVSEGIPMVLWIDARERTYGLQAEAGYLDTDGKAVQFELDDGVDVAVAVAQPPVVAGMVSNTRERGRATQPVGTLPAVRFWPDGSLVETSPEYVEFRENRPGQPSSAWIAQTPNRLAYEIRSTEPVIARR